MRKLLHRLAHEVSFRRRVLLVTFLFIAFCGEILLLAYDLPRHGQLVLHTTTTIALILLPFTIIAAIARLPICRRFVKSRFIIRAFTTVSTKSVYDGEAVASLLYREIISWQSKSARGSMENRPTRLALPASTVSLGITSLPLDWLWTQIRLLLTGIPDIIVEGILVDVDTPFKLKIWTSDTNYTWDVPLGTDEPFITALEIAMANFAPIVLESLDPLLAARIQSQRWNFDESIRLRSNDDPLWAYKLELAETLLQGGYFTQAIRLLDQFSQKSGYEYDVLRIQGEVLLNRGSYTQARETLQKAISQQGGKRHPTIREWGQIANSWAYENRYTEAIKAYNQTQAIMLAELCRLTGEKSLGDLRNILAGRFTNDCKNDIVYVLWVLREVVSNRSVCHSRLGHPELAMDDLQEALKVLGVIRELDNSQSANSDLQSAVICAAKARHHYELEHLDDFQEANDAALNGYENAFQGYSKLQIRAEDDNWSLAQLAWICFGKGCCLLRRLRVMLVNQPIEDPLLKLAGLLRRLAAELPNPAAQQFKLHFSRACQLVHSDREHSDEHLARAEAILTEGLIHESTLDALIGTLDEVELLESQAADGGATTNQADQRARMVPIEPEVWRRAGRLG